MQSELFYHFFCLMCGWVKVSVVAEFPFEFLCSITGHDLLRHDIMYVSVYVCVCEYAQFAVGFTNISSVLRATSKLPRVIDWKLFGKRAHEPYWWITL